MFILKKFLPIYIGKKYVLFDIVFMMFVATVLVYCHLV